MDYLDFSKAPTLQLEDFAERHIDSIRAEEKLHSLGLRFTIQNRTDIKAAVARLKKVAPQLSGVNLIGGYVFQPTKPVCERCHRRKSPLHHRVFCLGAKNCASGA